jgi:hypothetical protein
MTDTAIAEGEAGMDDVQHFQMVEEMVIFHHPDWAYLINATLPVRPATEEEAASYASRYDDGAWRDLYAPGEPRIITPPSAEVAALLEPAPEPEPPVLDEHTEAALAAFNQAHDELAAEEQHEVHHTQILYVPPAEEQS